MIDIKNGDIKFIIEYWEQDCLDIEHNQHILFISDTESYDITVTKDNIHNINSTLSSINKDLRIDLEFRVDFFDRIIFPTIHYGEKYYEYKYGNITNHIIKFFGLNIPLRIRNKWRQNN